MNKNIIAVALGLSLMGCGASESPDGGGAPNLDFGKGDGTFSIAWFGNSYTVWGGLNIPARTIELAAARGITLDIRVQAEPGLSLMDHVEDAATWGTIDPCPDVVVLQEASSVQAGDPVDYLNTVSSMMNLVGQRCADTRYLLYSVPAWQEGEFDDNNVQIRTCEQVEAAISGNAALVASQLNIGYTTANGYCEHADWYYEDGAHPMGEGRIFLASQVLSALGG